MGLALKGCVACLALLGCSSGAPESRDGPALPPRPAAQSCLAGLSEMPQLLSETGCFEDLRSLAPTPDLVPYSLNAPLWTDGAFKPRQMMVPPNTHITIAADGRWDFPDGSALLKSFGFEFVVGDPESRRIIETRFMVLRDGDWEFSTYRWNDEGTEAELLDEQLRVPVVIVDGGKTVEFDYYYPDRESCEACHGSEPGEVLGPKTSQLNGDYDYQGLLENQLVAMGEIGLFGEGVALDPILLPRMANLEKELGSTEEQARAYLDVNCSHCHKPGAWASNSTDLDLRYEVPLADTALCASMQYYRWAGIPRVNAGDSEESGLLQRMRIEGIFRMPSLGTGIIDPLGTEVVAKWIDSLDSCP